VTATVRLGGAWVTAKRWVRRNGTWVPLDNDVTPMRVRPDWTPDFTGNAGEFTFGFDVQADVAVTALGIYWHQPAGTVTDVVARLRATDGTLLASATATAASLATNDWNYVPFTTPYSMAANTTYVATAFVGGDHGYSSDGLPVTDPSGHVTLLQGRFEANEVAVPGSTWSGLHGLDFAFTL